MIKQFSALTLVLAALFVPSLVGCGPDPGETTYIPVAPPTEDEKAEAAAYTEQMLQQPGN